MKRPLTLCALFPLAVFAPAHGADDLATEINKLKALPGKNINVQGSPSLIWSLLELNLLDELELVMHPVAAGKGKRLFREGSLKRLELVEVVPTRTGTLLITYRPIKRS